MHARACVVVGIALAESDRHRIDGFLPTGQAACALVRVTRPHALVLLKCLAMDDRYRSLRGIEHYEHDRESARIHVADIVAVMSVQRDASEFASRFVAQLEREPELRQRIRGITRYYFSEAAGAGLLLYEEYLRWAVGDAADVAGEIRRANELLSRLVIP